MEFGLMITIDSRESKKVVKLAEKHELEFKVNALPIGDIYCEEKNIIFELKSMSDFANSIRSGHLFKQLLQQENYEHSYLIIIGKFGDLYFQGVKNFTTEHWIGSLASCAVRFKTKILQVDNYSQMMKLILKIIDKTDDGKIISIKDTELLKNKLTAEDMKLRILMCFNGVGVKCAEKLVKGEAGVLIDGLLSTLAEEGIYKGPL